MDVDPGGIGEEHEGQGHLGQGLDRPRVGTEVDEGERAMGHREPHDHEGDGGRNEEPLQPRRHQRPQDDAPGSRGQDRRVEGVVHWARPDPGRSVCSPPVTSGPSAVFDLPLCLLAGHGDPPALFGRDGRGGVARAAEGGRGSKAHIVQHAEQNVRCTLGWAQRIDSRGSHPGSVLSTTWKCADLLETARSSWMNS